MQGGWMGSIPALWDGTGPVVPLLHSSRSLAMGQEDAVLHGRAGAVRFCPETLPTVGLGSP